MFLINFLRNMIFTYVFDLTLSITHVLVWWQTVFQLISRLNLNFDRMSHSILNGSHFKSVNKDLSIHNQILINKLQKQKSAVDISIDAA